MGWCGSKSSSIPGSSVASSITAQGWQELGKTEGFGRVRRDFYVEHHRPKRLFVRELSRNTRRSLALPHSNPRWPPSKPGPARAASPAQVGFPGLEQVPRLWRQLRHHACLCRARRGRQAPEVVALKDAPAARAVG